jgi:hypothetical protein
MSEKIIDFLRRFNDADGVVERFLKPFSSLSIDDLNAISLKETICNEDIFWQIFV